MTERFKLFQVNDNRIDRKNKYCPKCGEGVFMAEHDNRRSCGKCGYTEFKKKK
ncbi:MAG: 30S ribosomal protein S27ae [Thermoplasmata archaeon]|nr:30S ribosomal protein S27ae [Thermoplasmata archaeon]